MSNPSPDLTPRSDNPILQKLHQERAEHEKEVKELNRELIKARNELFAIKQRLRFELIKANREKFETFYNQLMNLKTIELILWEEYNQRRHDLLPLLRKQEIDNSTYRRQLRPLSDKISDTRMSIQIFYHEGIERLFGADSHLFSIDGLQSLVKQFF